jgi:hypothetical protein
VGPAADLDLDLDHDHDLDGARGGKRHTPRIALGTSPVRC